MSSQTVATSSTLGIYKPHSNSCTSLVRKLIPARPPKIQEQANLDQVRCVVRQRTLFIEMRNGRSSHDDVDSLDTRRVRRWSC